MLITEVGILLQCLVDDVFQLWWQIGIYAEGGYRSAFQNCVEDDAGGISPKREKPCRHLVQDGPEREQIGSGIQFLSPDLLRRHVSDSAQRGAGAGKVLLGLDGRSAQGNALRLQ